METSRAAHPQFACQSTFLDLRAGACAAFPLYSMDMDADTKGLLAMALHDQPGKESYLTMAKLLNLLTPNATEHLGIKVDVSDLTVAFAKVRWKRSLS